MALREYWNSRARLVAQSGDLFQRLQDADAIAMRLRNSISLKASREARRRKPLRCSLRALVARMLHCA